MIETPEFRYYIRTLNRKGTFEVVDLENRRWAYLEYKKWLSNRAEGDANMRELAIAPQNVFQSKFNIFVDGEDVGDLIFNWKNQMIIRILDYQRQERQYLLRARGFVGFRFSLEDDIKNIILELKPKINWGKFRFDYRVYLLETQYLQAPVETMLAICAFAANLYEKRRQSSAAGSNPM